jgi:hypothetical protein
MRMRGITQWSSKFSEKSCEIFAGSVEEVHFLSDSLQPTKRGQSALLVVVVAFLGGGEGNSFVELFPCPLCFAESQIGAAKFQMVRHPPRLKGDGLLKTFDGPFVRGIGQPAINGLGQRLQNRIEIRQLVVPTAQDVPGQIIARIEARRGFRFLLYQSGHFHFAASGFVKRDPAIGDGQCEMRLRISGIGLYSALGGVGWLFRQVAFFRRCPARRA